MMVSERLNIDPFSYQIFQEEKKNTQLWVKQAIQCENSCG